MRDRFSQLRSSPRVFGLLFLAVLAAGILTAPFRVAAQQPAPAILILSQPPATVSPAVGPVGNIPVESVTGTPREMKAR